MGATVVESEARAKYRNYESQLIGTVSSSFLNQVSIKTRRLVY
jgi:hypothetical protein